MKNIFRILLALGLILMVTNALNAQQPKEKLKKEKIEKIAKEIYGADEVDFDKKAKLNLKRIDRLGFNDFAICMAKTQKSFSDNQTLIGRPKNFIVTVREIEIAAGAGFLHGFSLIWCISMSSYLSVVE